MLRTFFSALSFHELRKKLFVTFSLLWVCRICSFVPIPGIDADMALMYFRQMTASGQSLFQLVDIFSGGAFAQMTVGALGVIPYISASIILQLLIAIVPSLQREMKENGEYAKRKLSRWSRFVTFILAVFQSSIFARYALSINHDFPGIVSEGILSITFCGLPVLFFVLFSCVMTCGTFVIVWIGEQISEKGIGNGISLIISTGILASVPKTCALIFSQMRLDSPDGGGISVYILAVLLMLFALVIAGCIALTHGERKIPLQYARRLVGAKEFQSGSSFLPLKVNYAGVMPIIFASSVLMFPATLLQFIGKGSDMMFFSKLSSMLAPGSFLHSVVYAILIFFFNYFWTATQFHPDQIVSDMKKSGAFIPSVRQGSPTQEFIEKSMRNLTFIGAVCLIALAEFPQVVANVLSVDNSIAYFFGGTSMLILVGVVMDTVRQVQSYLMMHKYSDVIRRPKFRLK